MRIIYRVNRDGDLIASTVIESTKESRFEVLVPSEHLTSVDTVAAYVVSKVQARKDALARVAQLQQQTRLVNPRVLECAIDDVCLRGLLSYDTDGAPHGLFSVTLLAPERYRSRSVVSASYARGLGNRNRTHDAHANEWLPEVVQEAEDILTALYRAALHRESHAHVYALVAALNNRG